MAQSIVIDFNRAREMRITEKINLGLKEIEQLNLDIRQRYYFFHQELAKLKTHTRELDQLTHNKSLTLVPELGVLGE